jgi:hypothetical protein
MNLSLPAVMEHGDHQLSQTCLAFPWRLLVLDTSGKIVVRVGLPPAEHKDVWEANAWLEAHAS